MSLIDELRISNYRSIEDTGVIKISDNITTIIGQNAAGKSNLLHGITLFGDTSELDEYDICRYSDDLDRSNLDQIRIISIKFDDLNIDQFPYLSGVTSQLDLKSDLIKEYLGDTSSQNFNEDSEFDSSNFAYIDETNDAPVIISRYASGIHRISYGSELEEIENSESEYDLDEIIEKHEQLLNELIGKISEKLPALLEDTIFEADLPDGGSSRRRVEDLVRHLKEVTPPEDVEDVLDIDSLSSVTSDIDSILNTYDSLTQVRESPLTYFPPILQDISFGPSNSEVNHGELRNLPYPYKGLLRELIEASVGTEGKPIENVNTGEVDIDPETKEQVEDELSSMYSGFWNLEKDTRVEDRVESYSDDRFGISFVNREDQISLYMSNENGYELPANRESDGNRWLLSFLSGIRSEIRGNILDSEGIIVLDDPGIHFHPDFQQRLYNMFENYAEDVQVLFSTHSPFLIDDRAHNRIRVIRRDGQETKVMTVHNYEPPEGQDIIDSLTPVRIALGAYIGDYPFGGKNNLLVEGKTDELYIDTVDNYLRKQENYEHLDPTISTITTSGANEAVVIKLLDQEHQNFIIMKDDDASPISEFEGKYLFIGDTLDEDKARHFIAQSDGIDINEDPRKIDEDDLDIYYSPDHPGPSILQDFTKNYDMEEILYKPILFDVLSGRFELSKDDWRRRINGDNNPIGKSIKNVLTQEISNGSDLTDSEVKKRAGIKKGEIASEYCDILSDKFERGDVEDLDLMLTRFSNLFREINESFADIR